jgi:hypothetical protein
VVELSLDLSLLVSFKKSLLENQYLQIKGASKWETIHPQQASVATQLKISRVLDEHSASGGGATRHCSCTKIYVRVRPNGF